MAITVRELVTKLTVDGDKALGKLASFGLAVNGITAALDIMVRGFDFAKQVMVGFVIDQAQAADSLDKVAASTGLTTQALQQLSFVAEQTGIPMVNLIKGTQNLARNMRDAALAGEGKGSFNIALKEVGLTAKDLIGLSFPEQLGKIGDAMNRLEDPAARVAVSQKLLGEEAGPKMAAALAQGGPGIEKLIAQFEELGGATSDTTIKAGVDLVGALDSVGTFINLLKLEVLEAAPEITKMVKGFLEWLKINRDLLRSKMVAFFKRTVAALKSLANSGTEWFRILEEGVDVIFQTIGLILKFIDVVGGLENAIVGTAAVIVTLNIALIATANPIGALLGLLALGATAFVLFANNALDAADAQIEFGNQLEKTKLLDPGQAKKISAGLLATVVSGGKLSSAASAQLAKLSQKDLRKVIGSVDAGVERLEDRVTSSGILGTTTRAGKISAAEGRRRFKLLRKDIASARSDALQGQADKFVRDREEKRFIDEERGKARRRIAELRHKGLAGIGATGKGGKKSEPEVTEEELLKLISMAAKSGQSLTGLIGRRNIAGGVPPVIAMRIQNTTINQTNEVTIEVEGAGEDFSASELREEIIQTLEQREQTSLRQALEALQPAEAV